MAADDDFVARFRWFSKDSYLFHLIIVENIKDENKEYFWHPGLHQNSEEREKNKWKLQVVVEE